MKHLRGGIGFVLLFQVANFFGMPLLSSVSTAYAGPEPTYSYCVRGTLDSWAIFRYSAPVPGLACYPTADQAQQSMGDPGQTYWSSLPTNVNADLPPGATFDPQGCKIQLSPAAMAAMIPGKWYWGRCTNGRIVAVGDATNRQNVAPGVTASAPVADRDVLRSARVEFAHWKRASRTHTCLIRPHSGMSVTWVVRWMRSMC